MMSKYQYFQVFLLSLAVNSASAIEVQLPRGGQDTGFFKAFTDMMQNLINWISGPYALGISLIIFVTFAVGYYIDPRAQFLQSLFKTGFVIVSIFACFSAILNIYNSF